MRVPVVQPQAEPKKRRPSLRTIWKSVKLIFVVVVLASLAAGFFLIRSIPKRYNILVVGSDQRAEEPGRSDVLMVLSLTKSPKDPMSVVTIPRDTRVGVPGFGEQKITHAYALGEWDQGGKDLGNRELTQQSVEGFLGISIDATIETTFASFETIIDDLGGITTPSNGQLNGDQALQIVRDRSRPGGDFARTSDQREIVLAVMQKVRAENRWNAVYEFLNRSTESRITMSKSRFALFAAYAVVRRGGNFELTAAHTDVIPGEGKMIYTPEFEKELYYWVPDETATKELVTRWLS